MANKKITPRQKRGRVKPIEGQCFYILPLFIASLDQVGFRSSMDPFVIELILKRNE
jgi:hypothetical protein